MTTATTFYVKDQQITNVRLLSDANISGTYSNGPFNNGLSSTLTISASSLTVDGIAAAVGDRLLLIGQTSASQNGIYDVTAIGSTVVLTRSKDFQEASQMKPGYFIPVSAGDVYNGDVFGIIQPQVNVVGTDSILFRPKFSHQVSFDVTVNQAALASAGSVVLFSGSGAIQYRIKELFLNSGGTNFSGGGGDRLGQVTDGTTVFSVVPAATMQSLANARWGSTAVPFPASAPIDTKTAAGANLVFKYSGGTTDYTAGSLVISGTLERIA